MPSPALLPLMTRHRRPRRLARWASPSWWSRWSWWGAACTGLLSTDLLGQCVTRAHAAGMQVVAWCLPHFTDPDGDLRRLGEMVGFRAAGEGFDAVC
jgi:hypothetical protein